MHNKVDVLLGALQIFTFKKNGNDVTRKEFFDLRAKADYLKKNDITQCPPKMAEGDPVVMRRTYKNSKQAHTAMQNFAQRMADQSLQPLTAQIFKKGKS